MLRLCEDTSIHENVTVARMEVPAYLSVPKYRPQAREHSAPV